MKVKVRSKEHEKLIVEEATRLGVLDDAKATRDGDDSEPSSDFSRLMKW